MAKITIELDRGFISKTQSVDKQIRQRLLDVIGDNLTVDQQKSKRRLRPAFRTLLEKIVLELKEQTPKDTGRLARGWKLKTKRTEGVLSYEIVNENNYVLEGKLETTLLDVLEFGTTFTGGDPTGYGYDIRPRTKKALRFNWAKMGGAEVFFRKVRHPGIYKGKNPFVGFIGRARRRLRRRGTQALVELGKRI